MKTLFTLALSLFCISALAQTPNTNDIKVTVGVQLNLSTNQHSDAIWWYRQCTNGLPGVQPTFAVWMQQNTRDAVANQVADMKARRQQAEQTKADFILLSDWWKEATEAQRAAVIQSLPK